MFLLVHKEMESLLGIFDAKQQVLEFQIEHRLQNSSTIIELGKFLKSLDEIKEN